MAATKKCSVFGGNCLYDFENEKPCCICNDKNRIIENPQPGDEILALGLLFVVDLIDRRFVYCRKFRGRTCVGRPAVTLKTWKRELRREFPKEAQ